MRTGIVTVMLLALLLPIGGCWESLAMIGGGAAGGITWERLITQAQENAAENIELLKAQKSELEAELVATTDEAERKVIQTQIEVNKKSLERWEAIGLGLAESKKGLNVDWNNPEAGMIFILGAVATFLQWRKKNKTLTALDEVVTGGQEFKTTADPAAKEAFKKAQDAKQSTETKKMVAVLKA